MDGIFHKRILLSRSEVPHIAAFTTPVWSFWLTFNVGECREKAVP
jgi:hypothetical protein